MHTPFKVVLPAGNASNTPVLQIVEPFLECTFWCIAVLANFS